MLLTVNFEDSKVAFGYKILECKRGQSLMSLLSWAKRWNVSKSVINNFFSMLERDGMITIENETVTTRLTICNYETYQQSENATKTQQDRNSTATVPQQYHDTDTIKEEEELKKNKKNKNKKYTGAEFVALLVEIGVDEGVASDWVIVRKDKGASNTHTALSSIKNQIALSGLPANDCIRESVERSWAGFKAEWIKNKINSSNQQPAPAINKLLETWDGKKRMYGSQEIPFSAPPCPSNSYRWSIKHQKWTTSQFD